MLTGCIRCHGPVDQYHKCPICDAPHTTEGKIVEAVLQYIDAMSLNMRGERLPSLMRTVLPTEKHGLEQKVKAVLEQEKPAFPNKALSDWLDAKHRIEKRELRMLLERGYIS